MSDELEIVPTMGDMDEEEWERRVLLLAAHAVEYGWSEEAMHNYMNLCVQDRASITSAGHPALLDADLAIGLFTHGGPDETLP